MNLRGAPEFFRFVAVFSSYLMNCDPNDFRDFVQTRRASDLLSSYDFIIVGAGSAGSVLANRLSENPEWNVLLLEAGGQENHFSRTPLIWNALANTRFDWNYTSTKQTRTCLGTDGKCPYPRGRAFGGSSSVNGMIHLRGYKTDYDEWGVDNFGWSYKDVLPFFKNAEGDSTSDSLDEGQDGRLTISPSKYQSNIGDALLKGGIEMGWKNKECQDYEDSCIQNPPAAIRKGRRCSASTAYLEQTSRRPNLHVVGGVEVEKILTANNSATGVLFMYDKQSYIIKTRIEVIVSAGTINSPKLLMLSGIGLKEHLGSLGIPVVADLPVGNNLQDHVSVDISFKVTNSSAIDFQTLHESKDVYLTNQTGPLAFIGTDLVAWNKLGLEGRPIIQYFISTVSMDKEDKVVSINTIVVRPRTRGTVRLNSTDPKIDPLIDLNYYSDESDYELTRRGAKDLMKLMRTKALRRFHPKIIRSSQCHSRSLRKFIDCSIRYHSNTVYHPVGTVKMSPIDKGGVVNDKLEVYGVEKLRVVDASIAPTIVSMNVNAMALMIGEKGADMIKDKYLQRG